MKPEAKEVFTLSAVVQSVDAPNGFLMVKSVKEDKTLKVIISETTKLIRLEEPEEGTFILNQTEIKLSDLKVGDKIIVKSKENIAGKTEVNNVDYIQTSSE